MKYATILLLMAVSFAGCAEKADEVPTAEVVNPDEVVLNAGQGALQGLLIDDRFRPLPGGLVLLQPVGMTATSNEDGVFQFINLDPGTYTLRVTLDGHEASPQRATIKAAEFTDAQIVARRVVNEGGTILTTEYSVFVPCAVDFVANGIVEDCTLDQSDDTFRASFTANYTGIENATYLITEMKANKDNRYEVHVREVGNGERYAVAQIKGDYVKIVNPIGIANEEFNGQANNVAWNNTYELEMILFPDSEYREEIQSTGAPLCCGVGVHMGIRATFIQSVFIGEPEVDIASYCTLC